MAAAFKALGITEPADYVRPSSHAPGDDAEIAPARTNCTFPRDQDFLAVMPLPLDIVVVAVDGLNFRCEWRDNTGIPHRRDYVVHHDPAIPARVVLRPSDSLDVIVEVPGAFGEVCEIDVGEV